MPVVNEDHFSFGDGFELWNDFQQLLSFWDIEALEAVGLHYEFNIKRFRPAAGKQFIPARHGKGGKREGAGIFVMLEYRCNMKVLKVEMVQLVDELFAAVLLLGLRWGLMSGKIGVFADLGFFIGSDLRRGKGRFILLRMIYIRPHHLNPAAPTALFQVGSLHHQ